MLINGKRIAAVYCIHHDHLWLPVSVASIYPVVDRIYFLLSSLPWNGQLQDNSATLRTIKTLPDPQDKLRVIEGAWTDQVKQRNFGLELIERDGFGYQLVIDADELYEASRLSTALEQVAATPTADVFYMNWITYWKTPLWRIDPPELYSPPVILRANGQRFKEYRHTDGKIVAYIDPLVCYIHHLSYARPDELILRKIRSFSAARLVEPDWYEKVWLGWNNNHHMNNLHPVDPGQYQRAVPVPPEVLPLVLQNYLQDREQIPSLACQVENAFSETETGYLNLIASQFKLSKRMSIQAP